MHCRKNLSEKNLLFHTPRHIPPLNLTNTCITPPPDLLADFPCRDNIVHALPRFEMPEDRPGDIPVDVFDGFAGGCEKRPDEGGHGAGEDDDAEAGLQSLFARSLHFGVRAGMG